MSKLESEPRLAEITSPQTQHVTPLSQMQLKRLVKAIEAADVVIAEQKADQKEHYAEARALGFDTKVLRKVIKDRAERAADAQGKQAHEDLVQLYLQALGDIDPPKAALYRAVEKALDGATVTISYSPGKPT